MKYRDDRDALRHRADSLQQQLREMEDKLHAAERKVAGHEQKDAEDERQLSQLRSEVEHLRGRLGLPTQGPARRTQLPAIVGAVAALVVLAGAGVGFLLVGRSAPPDPGLADGPVPATPTELLPEPAPLPSAAAIDPPKPTDVAIFGAEVIDSQGGKVEIGRGCLLRAALAQNAAVREVTVSCGEQTLYRSTDARGSGVRVSESGVRELAGTDPGSFVYMLRYVDRGEHTGTRSEIDVDTPRHHARVFRQGAEQWSVALHVRDVSFPRWGAELPPLDVEPVPFTTGRHAQAVVTEKSGPVPGDQAVGSRCELVLRPSAPSKSQGGKPLNCRITLRCGATLLYGAEQSGFNDCVLRDGEPMSARDEGRSSEDTDPAMTFDWDERRVVLEDGAPGVGWRLALRLEEPPRCGLDGAFTGWTIDESGASATVSLVVATSGSELTLRKGDEEQRLPLGCERGLALLGEERRPLAVGPGFASLGGRLDSDPTAIFGATRVPR